ncbi:MAG: alpha/beta fold hydrolase [Thermoguttaceae bacterium]|nr:alpha/beta fold hydrolase [Thermoguttaceae bacterium]
MLKISGLRILFFISLFLGAIQIVSAKTPGETWNLAELKTAPEAQWLSRGERVVQDAAGVERTVETWKVWYKSVPFHGKPTRTFAFVSKPIGQGPFPAMVLVHGGGGSAFSAWTEMWAARGYVAIAMDLYGDEIIPDSCTEGANLPRKRMEDGGPNLSDATMFSPFPDDGAAYKDCWPYHCVANIMLAHSLIDSLTSVDADRVGVTGISWGGYLTALVAGVDDRFKVAVPVYGCGALTELGFVAEQYQAAFTADELKLWREYFEPNTYLPLVKCRVLFVDGTSDFAFPLKMNKTSYKATPNADARLQINMLHSLL